MTYNAKTDWRHDTTVEEGDFNRIETGIKDAHDELKVKADKTYVDGRVKTPVPKDAVFKDTVYTAGENIAIDDSNKISVTGQLGLTEEEVKEVKVNAAKDADTVSGHTVAKNVPADAKFTDTIVDISGKVDKVSGKGLSTNDYTDAEKRKVSDTSAEITSHKSNKSNPHSVTKAQVGLGNVTNTKQASETEFNAHAAKKATQNELGHIRLSDIPKEKGLIGTKEVDESELMDQARLTYSEALGKWVAKLPPDDDSGAPGSNYLKSGNMQAGYFGVVPASELFTGSEITSAVGITQGTAQFNNVGWLKFAIDGKIIYKSKKPFRHSISWDHIDSKGAVDGTKTVTKDGTTYRVRLMKGANEDPTDGNPYNSSGVHNSEWNKLMLPIHENAPSNWAYPDSVDSPTEDWGINFTDKDLHTHNSYGDGTYHWCQEVAGHNASGRVIRGYGGVSSSDSYTSSPTSARRGWSPVLEVIS